MSEIEAKITDQSRYHNQALEVIEAESIAMPDTMGHLYPANQVDDCSIRHPPSTTKSSRYSACSSARMTTAFQIIITITKIAS
jgi:hypothetical protein